MKRIGILSDTHSYLDEPLIKFFEECDEIWHAGDIGDRLVTDTLAELRPLRAVYGNIDTPELRQQFPENQIFELEGLKVLITHIGGYPGRYTSRVKDILLKENIDLYVCGHSHILKVMHDPVFDLLHINPGAAGVSGFHTVRTAVRLTLGGEEKISNLQVGEFGDRVQKRSQ
ncbi:MAG TPA: metallophosphoesterase [Saprospiraceae bacterium]|nr:metallophosphoesterase [Saprospiraceae bacterium]